jgi:hypothetical protein
VLVDPDTACVADASVGEQAPIDLYIMIDSSSSMAFAADAAMGSGASRWDVVTAVLREFVAAPANSGIGVGLGHFPHRLETAADACLAQCGGQDCACATACGCSSCLCEENDCQCWDSFLEPSSCDSNDYVEPAVEIATLPGAAEEFKRSLGEIAFGNGTPTAPALSAALKHAQDWISSHGDRRVAVVLATDGEPSGCDANTVEDAATVANAAFTAQPAIPTYVIGVGPSLDSLNAIAKGGGTEQAYLAASSDVAKELSDALASIRSRALSCDYIIPTTQGKLDYSLVNVEVTVGSSGAPTIIAQSPDASACGEESEWYYDDPVSPKVISLCPAICDQLLGSVGSTLRVLIGCETIEKPVK